MRKILFLLTLLLIGSATVLLWVDNKADMQPQSESQESGQAQLGGNFTLTDTTGKRVSDVDLRGQILLVFFGFTHCPDVCPLAMATFTSVLESLGDKATQVTPVFITVDPERDTQEVMAKYLTNFNPRIVGLTGSSEEIKEVAALYKTYYAKSQVPDASTQQAEGEDHSAHGMPAKADDYSIDHSGYVYMMGRDGKFIRIFPHNVSEQELLRALSPILN